MSNTLYKKRTATALSPMSRLFATDAPLSSDKRKEAFVDYLLTHLGVADENGLIFDLSSVPQFEVMAMRGAPQGNQSSVRVLLTAIFKTAYDQIQRDPSLQLKLDRDIAKFLVKQGVKSESEVPQVSVDNVEHVVPKAPDWDTFSLDDDEFPVAADEGGLQDPLLVSRRDVEDIEAQRQASPSVPLSGGQKALLATGGILNFFKILPQVPLNTAIVLFGNVFNLLKYGVPRDESVKDAARHIVRASLPQMRGEDPQTQELRGLGEKAYDAEMTLLTIVSAYMATATQLEADCAAEVAEKYPIQDYQTDANQLKAAEQVLCTPAGVDACPKGHLDLKECEAIIDAYAGDHPVCNIHPFAKKITDAYKAITVSQQHADWKTYAQATQNFIKVVTVFLGLKNAADLCVDPLLFTNILKPTLNTALGAAVGFPTVYYALQYMRDPATSAMIKTLKPSNPLTDELMSYLDGPAEAPGMISKGASALKAAYEFVVPSSPDSVVSRTADYFLTGVLGRGKDVFVPTFHQSFAEGIVRRFTVQVKYFSPQGSSSTDSDTALVPEDGDVSIAYEADFKGTEDFETAFKSAVVEALTAAKEGEVSIASYFSKSPEAIAASMYEILSSKGVDELTVDNVQEALETALGVDAGQLETLNLVLNNVLTQAVHTDSKVVQTTSTLAHYGADVAVPISIRRLNSFGDQIDEIIASFDFLSESAQQDILTKLEDVLVNGDPYISGLLSEKLTAFYLSKISDLQAYAPFRDAFVQGFTHSPDTLATVFEGLEGTELGKNIAILQKLHEVLSHALERVGTSSYKGLRLQQHLSKIDASINGASLFLEITDILRNLAGLGAFFFVDYVASAMLGAGAPQTLILYVLYTLYNVIPKSRA